MHSTIAKEQHLILQHETPSDDCRCETWKNAKLLLSAAKLNLGQTELATALLEDPIELMNSSVCTVKDFKYISGQCTQCPGSNLTYDTGKAVLRWQTTGKHMKKVQKFGFGEYVAELVNELSLEKSSVDTAATFVGGLQSWNSWKNILKENEVILSVDFSRNDENKQLHEVQSAYFDHENFTLYTAACYFHKSLGYWW